MTPNHTNSSSSYTKIGDRLRVMERFDPSKLTKEDLLRDIDRNDSWWPNTKRTAKAFFFEIGNTCGPQLKLELHTTDIGKIEEIASRRRRIEVAEIARKAIPGSSWREHHTLCNDLSNLTKNSIKYMMSFNIPKRQPSNKQPNSQSDPHPSSGLIKALLNTGRTKGSSATPAPPVISPTPSREYRPHIERMNNASQVRGNQSQEMSPANPRYGPASQRQGHSRNMSSVTAKSFQSGGYGSRQQSPETGPPHFKRGEARGSGQESDEPMTVSRLAQKFHEGMVAIIAKIESCNGINSNIQKHLVNETRRLTQEFTDAQRLLQFEFDKAVNDRNALYKQLDHAHLQLQAANTDRDRYCIQRDQIQRSVDELRIKEKQNSEKLEKAEQKWKEERDDLVKQIAAQEEQLKGKRALWLDSHPGSSARRDAMNKAIRDPFNSPSASQVTGDDSGYIRGSAFTSPSIQSPPKTLFGSAGPPTSMAPIGAPRGPRRRGHLPTGPASKAMVLPGNSWGYGSTIKVFNTEPASPPIQSMALVPFANEEDPASRYQAEFSKIFALVEGWVKTYSNIPNLANDQKIARSNDVLWAYMMNCTYPGHRQDSHTHVMTLLNDGNSRYWFIMRMAITYLIKDVMSIDAFYKFSPPTDAQFDEVKKKLQERGLANEARQKLIDQQAKAVQTIIAAPTYQDFRSTQLSHHSKRLRDMLGPLLNQGSVRAEAGRDLGAITIKAWELSVKMFTSHLTFQVYFPETATKFNAATMIAKDQPRVDPMHLQVKQTRLKLVITPVITLRDDRGTTIKAKNLHFSSVLTMG